MPETLAIIAALILDRPLCMTCLAAKADLPLGRELEARLERIRRIFEFRSEEGRCRSCGETTTVVSVGRPE